jgi:hypothetical protein
MLKPRTRFFAGRHATRRPRRSARRLGGSAAVDLVLSLPILVLFSLAVVQFGIFFINQEQVALAAREGAKEAARTASLSTTNGDPVPANVVLAVAQQLESSGIVHCRIRLEHNVGGPQVALVSPMMPCDCEPDENLVSPPPEEYVRLTVCVELTELMPDLMTYFGFDVAASGKVTSFTTIYRYDQ